MSPGRKATSGSFVADIKEHKEERERTILTVGGDEIEYRGEKSTRTAGLTTAKIFINSVISTKGARFPGVDIKKLLSQKLPRKIQIFCHQSTLSPT
jgi:hypothetical protein